MKDPRKDTSPRYDIDPVAEAGFWLCLAKAIGFVVLAVVIAVLFAR